MGRLSALFMPILNVLCRTFISKGELAYRYSQHVRPPHPIMSSGDKMLCKTIAKNSYSFEEPRNLSCGREYRAFLLSLLLRSSRLFEADSSPGLWPFPFSKGALADRYSQHVRPSYPRHFERW